MCADEQVTGAHEAAPPVSGGGGMCSTGSSRFSGKPAEILSRSTGVCCVRPVSERQALRHGPDIGRARRLGAI